MAIDARRIPTEGPRGLPTVGDVFNCTLGGNRRRLEVVLVEWNDDDQDLVVKMKPITEPEYRFAEGTSPLEQSIQAVQVPDSNPYKKTWHAKDAIEEGLGED